MRTSSRDELARENGMELADLGHTLHGRRNLVILIRSFTWVEVRDIAIQAGKNFTAAIETWRTKARDYAKVRRTPVRAS